MPCISDYPDDEAERKLHMMETVMCGLLSSMNDREQDKLLDKIDWKEVGVSKKRFLNWWIDHRKRDEARRKREARQALAEKKVNKLLGNKDIQDISEAEAELLMKKIREKRNRGK
jgi:hypothetical protein